MPDIAGEDCLETPSGDLQRSTCLHAEGQPEVETNYGRVRGIAQSKQGELEELTNLNRFRGIVQSKQGDLEELTNQNMVS